MSAPKPGSPEWVSLLTASRVGAILGLSPWQSPRSAWMEMAGLLPHQGIDPAISRRGHALESAVLAWWELETGGEIVATQHAATREDMPRCLATLDGIGLLPGTDGGTEVIVEAKTTSRWGEAWGEPGTDEVPLHILAQVSAQLIMSRLDVAHVTVLGPFLDFRLYVVERTAQPLEEIAQVMRDTVASLESGDMPDLSDHPADLDAVLAAAPTFAEKAEAEIDADLAERYLADLAHEARVKATKARVIDAMGEANYAVAGGRRIARRTTKGLTRIAALPTI